VAVLVVRHRHRGSPRAGDRVGLRIGEQRAIRRLNVDAGHGVAEAAESVCGRPGRARSRSQRSTSAKFQYGSWLMKKGFGKFNRRSAVHRSIDFVLTP
jgi:hypothetical protein